MTSRAIYHNCPNKLGARSKACAVVLVTRPGSTHLHPRVASQAEWLVPQCVAQGECDPVQVCALATGIKIRTW